MQLKNAKEWPEVYSCKFIEAGIVSYEDSDAGIALLKKETIDKMAPSFIGRPVIIQHKNVNPDNFKVHAVGYVINVHFNPEDAWFYADFIITEDEAKKCIDEGYSVSCAYNVIDVAEGGLWHDIKYDGEITEGSFTHLALVESPRYEDSKITKQLPAMLVNGKAAHISTKQEEIEMSIFKLFKKKENEKQEVGELHVALNGKAVPLADVLLYCINSKPLSFSQYKAENEKQCYMAKDEDIVDMNGHTISIGELKASYKMKTENEKKNANEKEEKPEDKEGKEMEAKKKNEKEEEEKKAKDEEKKNASEDKDKKKKEEEAKNAKEEEEKKEKENEAKEKEEEEKKNAKTQADTFFLELKNASASAYEQDAPAVHAPRTRAERAAAFRAKTNRK